MHSCQLYIIDMHIRHVNYNENYKKKFNKCVSSEQNFAVIVNNCTVFIIHLKCTNSVWLMSAEVHLFFR